MILAEVPPNGAEDPPTPTGLPSRSLVPPGDPVPGQMVAGARLVERVGVGLLGSFFRGELDDGPVAVHILRASVSDERRTAFVRALFHLYEATQHERPSGVLAPLDVQREPPAFRARLCAAGCVEDLPALRWPLGQRVEMFAKIAESLEWMHAHGLAHGALSPASVLLDDELDPWLAGIDGVHLALGTAADSADPTALRAYSPPEAKAGEPIDARSDVFGLGRILHFLLSSEHPEEPDEELPRLRRLRRFPEGLVRIVRKCTCLDPADRYPNVEALLLDVVRFTDHGAVGVAHPDVEGVVVTRMASLPPRFQRRARASLPTDLRAARPARRPGMGAVAMAARAVLVLGIVAVSIAIAWAILS